MASLATIKGYGAPSEYLQGEIGQWYQDLDTGIMYECIRESGYIRVNGDDLTHRLVWRKRSGEGLTEKLYSDILTWDGEGKYELEFIPDPDREPVTGRFKVSGVVPTYNDLCNGGSINISSVISENVMATESFTSENIVETESLISIELPIGVPVMVVKKDGYNPDLDMNLSKGIYLGGSYEIPFFVSSLTINGFNKFYVGEKIKEEYLPAGGGGAFMFNVDEVNGQLQVSRPFNEIMTALETQIAIGWYNDQPYYLTKNDYTTLLFVNWGVTSNADGACMCNVLTVNEDGTAEHSNYSVWGGR